MKRTTTFALPLACALMMTSCSGSPETLLSPSSVASGEAAVNPDGSTLKVTAPRDLGPNNATVDSTRPTLAFTNAAGRHVAIGLAYEIRVENANGDIVYTRVIGESGTSSVHTLESDLNYSDTYWWRVRARLGDQAGPWSDYAVFRTPDRPGPPPPPPPGEGGLPFPVPEACRSGGFACVASVAAQSVEWAACARGSGVGCHRFTRQVAHALASFDRNWANILAAPGGHACNCSGCGPSDGSMYREDTVVYAGREVFDMIVGAGGPSPSLSWGSTPGPRAGDLPVLAPLCSP